MGPISRRQVLKASATVVVTGAAVDALAGRATAGGLDADQDEAGPRRAVHPATVLAVTGRRADVEIAADGTRPASRVTVSVTGFPDGWVLRRGDQVVVSRLGTDQPFAAYPLIALVKGSITGYREAAGGARVTVAGTEMVLRPATLRSGATGAALGADTRRYEAHYLDNAVDKVRSCVMLHPAR